MGREIPKERWSEALSGFVEAHRRARVSVQIGDAGGEPRPLAPEADFELDLLELRPVEREDRPDVRLVLHRHPGAKIETAELPGATRVVREDEALAIEGEGGARMWIRVLSPRTTPS